MALTVAPRQSRVLPGHLHPAELEALFAAAASLPSPSRLLAAAVLELLYGTGLRVTELLSIRRTVFVAATDFLAVKGKGDRERIVPITPAARAAVNAMLATTEGPWVFGGRHKARPMTRQGLGVLLKRLAATAGVDAARVSPHTFRHTFATHMLANGADLRSLQTLLGHADISTTQIYTHVDVGQLADIIRRDHPLNEK